MPKNATVLVIRHGEKPASGSGLTPAGRERALAYCGFFTNFPPGGATPLTIDHVFAAQNSSSSCRPQLTVLPLAAALGLPIHDEIADTDYAALAKEILGAKHKYDNGTILICWHHEHALLLAATLGVNPADLPAGANWPSSWPGGPPPDGTPDVYGWVLVIVFDGNGDIDTSKTCCISAQLMYDDNGQPPPNG